MWQPPRWQPPRPRPPPPPPPGHPSNQGNEPAAKRGKVERICSICKASKSLQDCFSKSQRSKGANAKCKECIGTQQQSQQNESRAAQREANRKKQEEQLKAKQARHKKLEEERIAREAKRKQEEEERKRAVELRIAQERKKTIAVNEEKESQCYRQKRDAYERYLHQLKNEGKDFGTAMSTPANLVYVVTSIKKREASSGSISSSYLRASEASKFSPHLHGIYATCKKAQECARRVFEKESKSYRDGKFIPNEERTAKLDSTQFLIPVVEFNSRVMFELFERAILPTSSWEKPVNVYEYTAVGINAIPVDANDISQTLPFLRSCSHEHIHDPEKKERDVDTLGEGTNLFAIFSHEPGDAGDVDNPRHAGDGIDVNLCGVFRNRENAINQSLEERKEILKAQKNRFPKVKNGIPFYQLLHENCTAVAIEMVTLDRDHGGDNGKKLNFGTENGGSVWSKPEIEWF